MRIGWIARRLAVGAVVVAAFAGGGPVAGQTPRADTVTFLDAAEGLPGCCAVPIEMVARAAVKDLPGVLRVDVDEAQGQVTIRFDPARLSRAELIAALEPHSFRPVAEPRGPKTP